MAPRRNKVDVYVGERLRQYRMLAGLSQEELGRRVGLTFQQIQKYEKGANRVGAGRLYEFSKVLEVPLTYFYDGYEEWAAGRVVHVPGLSEPPPPNISGVIKERDPMYSRESLEMMRAFNDIRNTETRDRLFSLMKAIAGHERDTL